MVKHIPVLKKEAIDALDVKRGGLYIDCNLGGGGHTAEILKLGGRVIGFDVDKSMVERAKDRFGKELKDGSLTVVCENFANIRKLYMD